MMTLRTTIINKIDWGLLAALFIPLLALMPLLTHAGLPNTADGPVHLMRQVELNRAWAEGNFYPRWGTDLALGHGMPIFSYAPPLLYQLTQLLHLTGLPLDESMKGVVVLDFLLYSVGMFLLVRRIYGGVYPALLAAAVHVYAPYRLREAYIQGNYGQFTGLAFYPLIFWAFHGLLTDGRPRYWLAAPLALAGLLFSHNISAMLFAPVFAVYLLFLIGLTVLQQAASSRKQAASNEQYTTSLLTPYLSLITHHSLPIILRAVLAGLLGLGLAAIFWLPAFGERHDIKLEGITQGFFDFRENFISPAEFLSSPLPLDLTAINPEFPLSLGLPQLLTAVLGFITIAVWFIYKSQSKNTVIHNSQSTIHNPQFIIPHTLFFTASLLLYAFLALPYSQPLWETVPLLELTEFPWRMLGPAIFYASPLVAAPLTLISHMTRPPSSNSKPLHSLLLIPYFLLLTLTLALNAYYLYPSQFIQWGTPTPADAFAYEAASGAIGTTSTGEFLPRWAQQHPRPQTLRPDYEAGRPPQKLDPASLPPGAAVEPISHRAESDSLRIDTPEPFVATLRTLYWPGWRVYLNGQPAAFEITPNTGLIQTTVPTGHHTLTLRLESTPLRTIGLWLSMLSLVALVGVTGVTLKRQRTGAGGPAPATRGDRQAFAVTAGLMIGLYLISRPLEPMFTVQSNPNRPESAAQKLQIDFADQIRLVGVDDWPAVITLSPEKDSELSVVLYWRALQVLDTNYTIFLHLDAPNGQTVATVDEVNPENIPTGNWPPGLYLRNPLHLEIPANLPPIRYQLTTGIYNRQTGERLPLADDLGTIYALGPVWLAKANPPPAAPPLAAFGPNLGLHRAELNGDQLRLHWQTSRPIEEPLTIFVHVLDDSGALLNQADGAPFEGLYPLTHWRPGQLIQDVRPLALEPQATAVAIGIYNSTSGARLPAQDADGQPLPNNSFLLPVTP